MSHARSEYEDFKRVAPDAYDLVLALGQVAAKAGLDKQLLELVKLRASQINGCAFCVQHHVLLSERIGVPVDKLHLVAVWREAPIFSPRERAALAWAEALTLLPVFSSALRKRSASSSISTRIFFAGTYSARISSPSAFENARGFLST